MDTEKMFELADRLRALRDEKAEAEQAESERQAARGEDKGSKLDLSQFVGEE